jgi:hypothetical protein
LRIGSLYGRNVITIPARRAKLFLPLPGYGKYD